MGEALKQPGATRWLVSLLSLVWLGLAVSRASAAEIVVLCPRAVERPVGALAEAFGRETGHRVRLVLGTSGGLQARAVAGEPADLVIGSAAGIDDLAGRGLFRGGRSELGRVGVGVAVRAGAPVPDIGTPEALREAILAAVSLTYADPARGGQGGTHFARVLARLGIAEAVSAKTVLFPDGVMALERVARGELAMAAAPISEIVAIRGLTLVGPLPGELQNRLAYAASLSTRATAPEIAQAFLGLLTSPAGRAAFVAAGFEPPE